MGAFLLGADEGNVSERINYYGFTRGASVYGYEDRGEEYWRDDALPRLRKAETADTLHPHHDWTVILIQEKYQNYRLFHIKITKKQDFERKIIVKTLLFGCAYFFYAT